LKKATKNPLQLTLTTVKSANASSLQLTFYCTR